jgi:hypothetical protein
MLARRASEGSGAEAGAFATVVAPLRSLRPSPRLRVGLTGLALALLAVSSGTREVRAQVVMKAAPIQAWPDEQFEQWVFNYQGNAATIRQKFDGLLKLRIEEIDGNCRLTDEQKQKLRLMGCGDIKQVFDSFEKAKRQFKLLNNDVQKLQEVMPLVQPVQTAQHGLFQDGSLFAKSLRHTLTKEQFARYEVVDRARREFQHKAQIALAVHSLEESVPFRDAQRRELIALLAKELKPSRKSSENSFYILLSQIALLPEHKIKPLLTDAQWKVWDKQMRVYKNLIEELKEEIALDEEKFADPPAEAPK